MGKYINPPSQTKEQFISEFSEQTLSDHDFSMMSFNLLQAKNKMAVILLQNPGFSAACICWCEQEYESVKRELLTEKRPHSIHVIEIMYLKPYL